MCRRIRMCVAFCERGIRVAHRRSRRSFTRIDTFNTFRVQVFSLNDDFLLLFLFYYYYYYII